LSAPAVSAASRSSIARGMRARPRLSGRAHPRALSASSPQVAAVHGLFTDRERSDLGESHRGLTLSSHFLLVADRVPGQAAALVADYARTLKRPIIAIDDRLDLRNAQSVTLLMPNDVPHTWAWVVQQRQRLQRALGFVPPIGVLSVAGWQSVRQMLRAQAA